MKYMILSYELEADLESRDGNDASHSVPYQVAWWAYVGALSRAAIVEAIHYLRPNFTVTTVRFRDGKSFLQDGPYADTTEQIGACFVIDVAHLDLALDWAAKCPAAARGAVEVRPLSLDPPRPSGT